MTIDQTWAPQTRDLEAELPALMTRLSGDGFALFRVMYNPADWDETPRRAEISGRLVKLGAFNTMDRGLIVAVDDSRTNRVWIRAA
jgi:Family of unknown function (DUF5994)